MHTSFQLSQGKGRQKFRHKERSYSIEGCKTCPDKTVQDSQTKCLECPKGQVLKDGLCRGVGFQGFWTKPTAPTKNDPTLVEPVDAEEVEGSFIQDMIAMRMRGSNVILTFYWIVCREASPPQNWIVHPNTLRRELQQLG